MTKKQYAVLALAGILCVGLLGACSSGQNSEEETVTSSPAVSDEDPTDENDDVSEALYAAGVVLSVDGDQVVLQLYEDEDGNGGIADPDAFLPEDYTLSTETLALTIDDESVMRTLSEEEDTSAALTDLRPGSILLVLTDTDGTPTDVILQNPGLDQEDRLAQVTDCSDGTLTVTWYQSEDETEPLLDSYLEIPISDYLPGDTTETLTLTDDVAVYMLEDGCLFQADAEDLLAGDTVIVTLSSDGAPVQLICVSVSEDTGTTA